MNLTKTILNNIQLNIRCFEHVFLMQLFVKTPKNHVLKSYLKNNPYQKWIGQIQTGILVFIYVNIYKTKVNKIFKKRWNCEMFWWTIFRCKLKISICSDYSNYKNNKYVLYYFNYVFVKNWGKLITFFNLPQLTLITY